MIAAVTGATGYVGRFVVHELSARGWRVRAWRRDASDTSGFSCPVEWIAGGLGDAAAGEALVAGADALVHAAFEHLPGRYRGGEGDDLARFLDRNLMGSLRLLELARRVGVPRCVVLSSRAVFGRSQHDEPLGEDHPARPDTHYGAHKLALEAFVSSWGRQRWHVAALRPTGVYGLAHPPERSKWWDLVGAVARGEPWRRNRGATEVHGADVARAVALLLEREQAAGEIYNCSDLYVTERELAELVQRISGSAGPLPDADAAPFAGRMSSAKLERLGFAFGGRALLERTVAELVGLTSSA